METVKFKGREVKLDDDGYLENTEDWTEDLAQILAKREGISELTGEQLAIIRFLRSYYQEFHAFPILRSVCRNLHKPRQCINETFIDPMKAWKIAGLPHLEGVDFVSTDEKGSIFEAAVPT